MDQLDIQILYAMSGDMPLSLEPFKDLGEQVGIQEREVLERIHKLREKGIVKRIAPILYHQKTTFQYNALTIWAIEKQRVDEIADVLMDFKHISHVYERESCQEWSYNLYGMLHGRKAEDIDRVVEEILKVTGPVPHKVIYTTKEWKKTSPDLKCLLEKNRLDKELEG